MNLTDIGQKVYDIHGPGNQNLENLNNEIRNFIEILKKLGPMAQTVVLNVEFPLSL